MAAPDDHQLAAGGARPLAVPGREDARVRGRGRGAVCWSRSRSPSPASRSSESGTCRRPGRRAASHCARNALVAGLLGAFGVGIGALVRNQAVAIVGILMFALAVEPTLVRARTRRRALHADQRRCRPRSRTSIPRRSGLATSTCSPPGWRCWRCSPGSARSSRPARRCCSAATSNKMSNFPDFA